MLTEIAPIDDIRSTAEYRRRVAANLLAEFWATCGRVRPSPRGVNGGRRRTERSR
jgi:xanthine dehydrogenase iron-sulfur cluster and FAD-binding subunit A